MRARILACPPFDAGAPAAQERLMNQLIAGLPGSETATEILPRLDLGRAGDTVDPGGSPSKSPVEHSRTLNMMHFKAFYQ